METKELTIQIPEGYEIDKEKSTFEKIVFKEKEDTKPRSWEEYYKYYENSGCKGYIIANNADIIGCRWINCSNSNKYRSVLPSSNLAEAFRAMMQLMSLRHDWIHKWSIDNGMTVDWEPDWKDHKQLKANIIYNGTGFDVIYFMDLKSRPLSFPTKEIAEHFMNCFKDLLNIAKSLI